MTGHARATADRFAVKSVSDGVDAREEVRPS